MKKILLKHSTKDEIVKLMNQKGFAPALFIFVICVVVVVGAGIYLWKLWKIQCPLGGINNPCYATGAIISSPRSSPVSSVQSPTASLAPSATQPNSNYTSLFGFSFINPTSNKVSEKGYSLVDSCQSDQKVTSRSKADEVAFLKDGYFDYIGSPSFIILRMDSIGAGQIGPCGPGDQGPYQFFLKDNQLFKEVENLISKKVIPSQTNFFNDTGGIIQRFSVASYLNPTSRLYGITNLRISGYGIL